MPVLACSSVSPTVVLSFTAGVPLTGVFVSRSGTPPANFRAMDAGSSVSSACWLPETEVLGLACGTGGLESGDKEGDAVGRVGAG